MGASLYLCFAPLSSASFSAIYMCVFPAVLSCAASGSGSGSWMDKAMPLSAAVSLPCCVVVGRRGMGYGILQGVIAIGVAYQEMSLRFGGLLAVGICS